MWRIASPLAKSETAVEVTFARATKINATTPITTPPIGTIHSVGSSDPTTSAEKRPIEQTAPGRYEGPFSLPMDGSWPLTIEVRKDGLGQATLNFEMATRRSGLELTSGGQPGLGNEPAEELPAGTITVDARRRQTIGLKTGEVRRVPMQRRVRAVGNVTYDQTRLSDVTPALETPGPPSTARAGR